MAATRNCIADPATPHDMVFCALLMGAAGAPGVGGVAPSAGGESVAVAPLDGALSRVGGAPAGDPSVIGLSGGVGRVAEVPSHATVATAFLVGLAVVGLDVGFGDIVGDAVNEGEPVGSFVGDVVGALGATLGMLVGASSIHDSFPSSSSSSLVWQQACAAKC